MSAFRLVPRGAEAAASTIRRGAVLESLGLLIVSLSLFMVPPLLFFLGLAVGTLLVLGGFLSWLLAARSL